MRGLYLGRPGWGLGRLRGGREPAWLLERGGWGSSPSRCPLTDELGNGPGL